MHILYSLKERDQFSSQLEKIEEKAMKSFTTSIDNDINESEMTESSNLAVKQFNDLKNKIG